MRSAEVFSLVEFPAPHFVATFSEPLGDVFVVLAYHRLPTDLD
jgi:hypothetical protein